MCVCVFFFGGGLLQVDCEGAVLRLVGGLGVCVCVCVLVSLCMFVCVVVSSRPEPRSDVCPLAHARAPKHVCFIKVWGRVCVCVCVCVCV